MAKKSCAGHIVPKSVQKMNGTERAYADYLELQKKTGLIVRYDFEPERLKLAEGSYYTPDFRVILPNLEIEFHEVKGFMREAANVRIKVAAEVHPYTFKLIRKVKKDWDIKEVG
jgi:hypothetical protein